jgi:putative glutamine amidotransferase
MTPLVGIPACAITVNDQVRHTQQARYGAALLGGAGAVPVLIPPVGEAALAVLDRLDGLLLSGSPSNVEPHHYGAPDQTPGEHDPARDGTTLPLIREALRRGLPLLGICRGIQEMNVAFGGSLHQEVHRLDGRQDHRGGEGTAAHRYRPKHAVALRGGLAAVLGRTEAVVNSVHGQALDRLGDGLAAEAEAPDGTVEGVRVTSAPGWAYGVQWHPEWGFADDPVSLALFGAFGAACRAYAEGARRAA